MAQPTCWQSTTLRWWCADHAHGSYDAIKEFHARRPNGTIQWNFTVLVFTPWPRCMSLSSCREDPGQSNYGVTLDFMPSPAFSPYFSVKVGCGTGRRMH